MAGRRVLIRGGRAPHVPLSNEAALGWRGSGTFGSNAGNMLFSESVHRAISVPGTEVVCDAYAPEWRTITQPEADQVNEAYDQYVVPLANAFRPVYADEHLVRLTHFIQQLTIPVVVVGTGVQLPLSGDVADMPASVRENTTAFVRAVLEKSASIGVRGEITRDALLAMGFADSEVDIIGCPSIYHDGPALRVDKPEAFPEHPRLAMNVETNVPGLEDVYRANEAAHPDLITIYQTLTGADLVVWGQEASHYLPGLPRSVRDAAYLEGRMRFFTNGRSWRQQMRELDFAFGIRIHGNASALSVGTPAYMLMIDSRTRELAEYHEIPRAAFNEVHDSGRYLARDLWEAADFGPFNARVSENFQRYTAFLDRNGIEHVFTPGNENPDYDRRLAEADLPGAALPLPALSPGELATRVNWLWQGRKADGNRPVGSHQPEFELDRTHIRHPAEVAHAALSEARTAQQQSLDGNRKLRRVRRKVNELESLRAEVDELRTLVEALGTPRRRPGRR